MRRGGALISIPVFLGARGGSSPALQSPTEATLRALAVTDTMLVERRLEPAARLREENRARGN